MKKFDFLIGVLIVAYLLGTIKDIIALIIVAVLLKKNTQSK